MFDNIDMALYKSHCPDINFLKDIPQYLTKVSNHGFNQFGEYITGYLDNLKISITESKIKIYDSSLCKYYLGDNFKTLTRGDTKRAIEKISNCLHLPFQLANVTRIDIAQNLIMKYDEKLYYPLLGEVQYYTRLEQNNGLYYNNLLRQLLFYGKEYEQKIKRQPIPEMYKDRNVLRFEMRFKKRLGQQLKQPEITAGLLYNQAFYNSLVKRWNDEYFAIQKINSKATIIKPTTSTKDLIDNMALLMLLEIGQPKLLTTIEEWQKRGITTKKQAKDQRDKIKLLASTPINEIGNELIIELDRKIKDASRYW